MKILGHIYYGYWALLCHVLLVGGRLRDQSHFGHGVTKIGFFSKNLSICQFWLFSSVKWDLHPTEIHWKNCARKMTKAERGTREVFGIFRVLRLDINLFFGENNVFNMFWVNEKLLEAFILLSVQFWNFRFFKKKGALSWPIGQILVTAWPILVTAWPIGHEAALRPSVLRIYLRRPLERILSCTPIG